MPTLTEVREEMKDYRDQLHLIFQQAGSDMDMSKVSAIQGSSEEKVAEIQRINAALDTLGQQHDRLALAENVLKTNAHEVNRLQYPVNTPPFGDSKTEHPQMTHRGQLKQLLTENKGYQQFKAGSLRSVTLDLPVPEFKTLITLTDVNAQASRRGTVDMALEERTVADLMLQGQVDGNTVEYYEETTVTNNAAAVAEGTAKPESALGFTLQTEAVRKVAHFIPATKEALDDVSFLESQIRGRLAFGIQRAEEAQILTGTGVAPNLRGILNRTGIQTQAAGTDPVPDAVYRAMQLVRGAAGAGFAEPTAVVMNPNDWTSIKLLRTADGIYIWGNPSDEGPDRIWGLTVRQTTAMTENTALVGDFRFAEVLRREGVQVTLSTEHANFFTENKVAILAEARLALAVYRPSAFATVTGI